jgi:DNA mismatch endonuclease, patch repair protein
MVSKKRAVPSFMGLSPTSRVASSIKSRTKASGSKAELRLRRVLRSLGMRFRLHDPTLPGKPDLVFPRARVVVFCDGDFWHGRLWVIRRARLVKGANATYWVNKIEYNMRRDRHQSRLLRSAGWKVVRLWETDILARTDILAEKIAIEVRKRANQ